MWSCCCIVLCAFCFFDTIRVSRVAHHLETIEQLQQFGLGRKFAVLLTGLSADTVNVLKIGGVCSPPLSLSGRLAQGSTWSPTLAAMLLDEGFGRDLREIEKNVLTPNERISVNGSQCNSVFYADDLILAGRFHQSLSKQASLIRKQCHREGCIINEEKSKVLSLRISRKKDKLVVDQRMSVDGIGEDGQPQKYLGLWLCEAGDWSVQRAQTLKKMEIAANLLMLQIKQNRCISWLVIKKLFIAKVRSVATYGFEMWIDACKPFQNKLIAWECKLWRKVLGIWRRPSNSAVLWLLGCIPLHCECLVKKLQFVIRIKKNVDHARLEHDALLETMKEHKLDGRGWWHECMRIIESTSLWNKWVAQKELTHAEVQGDISVDKIKQVIKAIEQDAVAVLYADLRKTGSKHGMLIAAVPTWESKRPLKILGLQERKSASAQRWLLASTCLEVEVGRFRRVSREHRFCECCRKLGVCVLGDELHCITTRCCRALVCKTDAIFDVLECFLTKGMKFEFGQDDVDSYIGLAQLLDENDFLYCWRKFSKIMLAVEDWVLKGD